jgi:putative membrane protein
MKKFRILHHFNWKIFSLRILINALALFVTAGLIPDIYFLQPTFSNLLLVGLVLGILNALVRPVLMFLTAQLFFATFGLLVILINAIILYLLDWLLSQIFTVESIFWALIGGLVLGLLSSALENLFGLTPPIVPDEEVELRRRVMEQSASPLQTLVGGQQAPLQQQVETQSLEELQAARAAMELINASPPADVAGEEAASQVGSAGEDTTGRSAPGEQGDGPNRPQQDGGAQ